MRPTHAFRVLSLAALATLCLSGCKRTTTEPASSQDQSADDESAARKAEAEAAVDRALELLEQEDCAALVEISLRPMTAAACEEMVHELKHHGMKFVRVVGSDVDGRNPDAVIVRTEVAERDSGREMLLRAELVDGTWKVLLSF